MKREEEKKLKTAKRVKGVLKKVKIEEPTRVWVRSMGC